MKKIIMVIFFLLSKICKSNAILKSLKNNKIVLNIITNKQEPHIFHHSYNNININNINKNNKKNRNKNKIKIKINKNNKKEEGSFFYTNNYKKELINEPYNNLLILHRRNNNWITKKRDNIFDNHKNLKTKKHLLKLFINKNNYIYNRKMFSSCINNNCNTNDVEVMKKKLVVQENPEFIKRRLEKFNEIKEKRKKELEENVEQLKRPINIELLDGSIKSGESYVTTPFDIALSISKRLAEDSIVCKVTYLEKVDVELCDVEEEDDHNEENDNTDEEKNKQDNNVKNDDNNKNDDNKKNDDNDKNDDNVKNDDNDKNDNGNNNKNHNNNNNNVMKSLLWDLNVPLIGNCKLEFINIQSEEGQKVFWHSSAHILGSSLERLYGGFLTIGPALKEGFYYDIFLNNFSINNEDYKRIEDEFNKLVKENVAFEKVVCTKEEALELFEYNPFKLELIRSKIPDNKKTCVYKCGNFIDLCLGPHIKNTGKVKTFKVLKNSSAYWLGQKENDSLQRIYGISFQKKSELTEYLKFLEEAKKRDHRNVGKILNLFFFEKETSPGSCFWLPHGSKIYNKLIEFIRKEYRIRKYEEVISPNVFSCELWKTSGHYQNYKDCMFLFNVENKEWGMKPMNCPGHCLMFKQLNVSYRSLPVRLADFGVLHRNEISGSLSGLTRVRRFQQDDSHIFCSMDHIKQEVLNTLNFLFYVYNLFGFKYELFLSTRPKKFIGQISTWNLAEQHLKDALDAANIKWKINEGDGAFYGPKIDILVKDSLNRTHQCGTIQLDFQLPVRFNLQYKNKEYVNYNEENEKKENEKKENNNNDNINNDEKKEFKDGENDNEHNNKSHNNSLNHNTNEEGLLKKGFERPIIIHRAILGSVERFVAILIEHTAGKLPFWLSPRQAMVLPVSDKYNDYANYVYETLNNNLFDVDIDLSVNTLNKKIREAQLKQFNYILVVGEKELTTNTVTLRDRDDQNNQHVYTIQELIDKFKKLLDVNSMKFNQINEFNSNQGL
ncbi:threonine--tRNA ligase [Plasmodium sp. gorilla clade G2]|uniref:threonine--tRNA ligase n=1 Tax=Plasmodium sp. gorilla clade G2 TaxID=880535 RepID=UPI000D21FF3E|nr:threonine--tRNA ligase [Plasmodium sp. gorilla clade G2]SOV15732.1 threonine--tRNA ligase [Plasmodium sp. gorilla clade G2]